MQPLQAKFVSGPKPPKENKSSLNKLCVYFRKLMQRMPSQESARKPRENINIHTLNMDSRSGLISIKLIQETNVSVQIYRFLKARAVRYDEKPEKDVISVIS